MDAGPAASWLRHFVTLDRLSMVRVGRHPVDFALRTPFYRCVALRLAVLPLPLVFTPFPGNTLLAFN